MAMVTRSSSGFFTWPSFTQKTIRPSGFKSTFSTRSRLIICCSSSQSTKPRHGFRGKPAEEVNVMVAGSTGYIGKFVVNELVSRGYKVLAVARKQDVELEGAQLLIADVTRPESIKSALSGRQVDVVISCLASRGGGVKDSWAIDYEATRNIFQAGLTYGASHMVLLSAICVQKPLLEFQKAKLRLEGEMQDSNWASGASWSIVRPTAFFKSLGGQVEIVKGGSPFVVFGDGKLCACKPISERDLASFIVDCVEQDDKANKVLPIGGPGPAYTPLEQGELLFRILDKKPSFIKVPIQVMDFAISCLDTLARLFPSLEDPAEYAKIGRYYAAESMLVLDPVTGDYVADATPSYGTETLEQFFRKVVADGMAGQELGQQAAFLRQ